MFLSLAPSCHRLLPALRRALVLPLLLLLALLLAAPAAADPTGRVGRIAWLSGSVHLHRADSGESTNALLNWPITSGDILSTAAGARSEVQLGSTSVQFDASSILEFVAVDDQRVRLHLLTGSVIIRLRSPEAAAEFELSSRDGSFSFSEAGSYRFDAEPAATVATVHGGSLRFAGGDGALDLRAGQRTQLWNDGGIRYQVSAPVEDAFVLWSAGREQGPASAAYGRYVSPEMTGAADLDAHGRWHDSPEYGAVWFPQAVAADWAPYRHGRWMWVAPWGWTWVGDEPWGFAPFHYGRWVIHRGAWGWVPGKRVARPVYAPALVAWVGSPGASVSVQVGARPAVGWFPLAPREVYVPPYRSSARHVRAVNVTHVTQINNITTITNNPQAAVERMPYAHRQMPRAVTMVPADVVAQQRPIDRAAMLPRDGKSLGARSVQVQAPVAVPPVDAGRGGEGRRPMAQDGRERGALAERREPSTGGLPRQAQPQPQPQPQPQQRPAARPNDVAIGQPQPAPATAPAAAAASAGAPPRQPGALPAAGSPSSLPAAGQRPDAEQGARPVRETGRVPRSEPLDGRGEPPRLTPLPGVASPIDRGAPAVPVAPPAVSMPPATQGTTTSTAAPAERPDRLPAATAGRGAQSAERPVTAVEHSVSGAPSGRPEEHAKPPAQPVVAPPPAATLPRFPERPAVSAPVPAQVQPQAQPQAQPQVQPQVPRPPQAQAQPQVQPQAQAQPQVQPQAPRPPQAQPQAQPQAPRPPQAPPAPAPQQAPAPGVERSGSRVEPRRADDVARREEAFARQQKPEASVDARPAAMPQRSVAPAGDAKSPPPEGRQSRPERPREAGEQREGRGGGGGRVEQLPRGADG